jgi:hypothetical protein
VPWGLGTGDVPFSYDPTGIARAIVLNKKRKARTIIADGAGGDYILWFRFVSVTDV